MLIFFSDVRGFTSFSQNHYPEQVIQTLNVLLGLQGDIIEKHGGYVDKFVGDEVVAIFEGSAPERVRSGLLAATEIQACFAERADAAGASPDKLDQVGQELQVGIALSMGDMVMDSMGSRTTR